MKADDDLITGGLGVRALGVRLDVAAGAGTSTEKYEAISIPNHAYLSLCLGIDF